MKKLMRKKYILLIFAAVVLISVFFSDSIVFADNLADAISKTPQGTEKGMIDPNAEPGFLNIS